MCKCVYVYVSVSAGAMLCVEQLIQEYPRVLCFINVCQPANVQLKLLFAVSSVKSGLRSMFNKGLTG